jgi:hypothetical protein
LTRQVTEEITRLHEVRQQAQGFITKAQERQKKYYDRKADLDPLLIGQQVLVYRTIIEGNWSAKLEPKWEGPYLIHQVFTNHTYQLKTMDGVLLKTKIHRNRIRLYYPKETKRNDQSLY